LANTSSPRTNSKNKAGIEPEAVSPKAKKPKQQTPTSLRTFVLDTSVLLSDPKAMFRFAEHEVVLPIVVINELEKKAK